MGLNRYNQRKGGERVGDVRGKKARQRMLPDITSATRPSTETWARDWAAGGRRFDASLELVAPTAGGNVKRIQYFAFCIYLPEYIFLRSPS